MCYIASYTANISALLYSLYTTTDCQISTQAPAVCTYCHQLEETLMSLGIQE